MLANDTVVFARGGSHRIHVDSFKPHEVLSGSTAERIFADSGPGEREFYERTVPFGRVAQPEEVARAILSPLRA